MSKRELLLKYTYIALGTLFVVFGFIGIFLPVMPTTIFLIIAAYFYAKSSEKLYDRLVQSKLFGKMIRDYMEHKAMPLKAKITALIMLNGFMAYAISFAAGHYILQLLLFHTALFVSLFILSLKTIDAKPDRKINEIIVE